MAKAYSTARCIAVGLIFGSVLVGRADAQIPYDSELLTNGDFESATLLAWAPTSGTTALEAYGATFWSANLAQALGGGASLLHDSSVNAKIQQNINVSANATDINAGIVYARVSADLGGRAGDDDRCQINIKFLDALTVLLNSTTLGPVNNQHRNGESVLLRKSLVVPVPANTAQIAIEVQFIYANGTSGANGAVDNVHLEITKNPVQPALPVNQELIDNGTFEQGYIVGSILSPEKLSGWTGVNSTVGPVLYGTSGFPSNTVSSAIGGGQFFLDDLGNNGRVRQDFDLGGNAAMVDAGQLWLHLGGNFGGSHTDTDRAYMEVVFYGQAGELLSSAQLGDVTNIQRLYESVMMRRTKFVPVPALARRMTIDLVNRYENGTNGANGAVDNLSAKLVTSSGTASLPYDQELLVNPGFETGYTPGSMLTPSLEQGWVGASSSVVTPTFYGGAEVPGTPVSQALSGPGGGVYLARDTSNGRIEQLLDVSGNSADIDAETVFLEYGGWLGGYSNDTDNARVEAAFLDGLGALVQTEVVDPVTRDDRFSQTTLVRRFRKVQVPALTRGVRISLVMSVLSGVSGQNGYADNLSAVLTKTGIAAQSLGVNLITNPGFEDTDLLDINSHSPWRGITSNPALAKDYGSQPTLPDASVSQSIGGGQKLLGDFTSGNAALKQVIDLRGNKDAIDDAVMAVRLSGMMGGYSTDTDNAEVIIRFYAESGSTVLLTGTLGPVTPADRQNITTLLERHGDFPVPPLSRRMEVEVDFDYNIAPIPDGVADNISATLFNVLSGTPVAYPGTGEDLHLFSGMGAQLTTGGGFDVKEVSAGQVVTLRFSSLSGGFNFAPLVVLAGVFPTGSYPGGLLPGVPVPSTFVFLIDGLTPALSGAQFNPFLLFPWGSTFGIAIPPGISGYSVLVQGLVVPGYAGPGFSPQLPLNGLFAGTDAHEFQVQ